METGKFTPHARGSTSKAGTSSFDSLVYPACAGIDHSSKDLPRSFRCLPRMRGDRPILSVTVKTPLLFTPHARGSTACRGFPPLHVDVYPACAGIDLAGIGDFEEPGCLPRMRGDRPRLSRLCRFLSRFTPHARGSTVPGTCEEQA